MAIRLKPTHFTRQNFQRLLSSNGKAIDTHFLNGKTINTDSLPMEKLSTSIVFKWQNCWQLHTSLNGKTVNAYYLQMAIRLKPTHFTRQNIRRLLSSNGKTIEIHFFKRQNRRYSLPIAKLSITTVFKWQNRRNLLHFNYKTVSTYRKNRQHLLSSNGTTVTPTIFKWQSPTPTGYKWQIVDTSFRQTAVLSTSTVFKWQYRTTPILLYSLGNAIGTYSLLMAIF
jgi:hypothetical protein